MQATKVTFEGDNMIVDLSTGRVLEVPVARYPHLWLASKTERANYRLIGGGVGIHWPDLDEDVSVDKLVRDAGQ